MSRTIRVALIGVGNCASALVQGIEYYKHTHDETSVPGLMHVNLGGYRIGDITVSAAFDVADTKVDTDLADAIFAPPNNTYRFAQVPHQGVTVSRGVTLDGLNSYLRDVIAESPRDADDVVQILRETRTDVVVSYLPVGSEAASRWYAERALEANCAFINCVPVFLASQQLWRRKFEQRGLPLIGDDIKSQVGATITHRILTRLFEERGVRLDRTYQLNFGGNSDFLNMLDQERLSSKKQSKTNAVNSQLHTQLAPESIHIGPSDYVPWLGDRKWCYVRMEGTAFGDVPLNLELKLEVWDSPNSAGVVIDAIRCAKLALDRNIGGAVEGPSAYFMTTPPRQSDDHEARNLTEEFIVGKIAHETLCCG